MHTRNLSRAHPWTVGTTADYARSAGMTPRSDFPATECEPDDRPQNYDSRGERASCR